MDKLIKITLSIFLMLCLFDMPYSFYQLVRFSAMVGFGILSFQAKKKKQQVEMVIYACLSILFQPIFKISLGRELWNIVDLIVAVALVLSVTRKQ